MHPRDAATSIGRDWDNNPVYLSRYGRFEIGYVTTVDEMSVTFTLLRPNRG